MSEQETPHPTLLKVAEAARALYGSRPLDGDVVKSYGEALKNARAAGFSDGTIQQHSARVRFEAGMPEQGAGRG